MALIGKIRNNMWFVIILLALGLGGFVFMDISSVGGMSGGNQMTVGAVDGNEIEWASFQRAQEALYPGSDVEVNTQRDYVWSYFVEEAIISDEAESVGLFVGEEEMEELQFGTRLSPVVQRNFTDPQTGQVNRESIQNFRQMAETGQLAPQYQRVWEFQPEEVRKERLEAKLVTLVRKGIYTPTWMVEDQQKAQTERMDFRYVFLPYDLVSDSEIEVTDADYAAYVKKHKNEYDRQMEMRDARYVVFDVFPTEEDSMHLLEDINKLVADFRNADDDSTFAVNLGGTFDVRYHQVEELSEAIADTIFSVPVDSVYGPYIDEGAYKAVKVLDRKVVPDSVRARHILIQVQTQEQVQGALALADSLETVLMEDITQFDTLARQFSQDPVSGAQGGDLGFVAPDAFVKPMNDLLFFTDTKRDTVYRVISQFGIHLVEILEENTEAGTVGVQLAYISEPIVPSEITQDILYDEALNFALEHRSMEAITSTVNTRGDLVLEEANNIPRSGYQFGTLSPGIASRDIVRWMYAPDTEAGDVAPSVFTIEDEVNYFNSQYVIVALEAIHPEGIAKPESIMDRIEGPVKNAKRAEVLISKIQGDDLNAIAGQFGVSVDTVENVHIGISQMNQIGEEPKVLGTAAGLAVGAKSGPIEGRNGVYVIEVIDRIEGTIPPNVAQMRRQTTFQFANSAEFELISALRKNAKIKDNRYTFF